MVSYWLLTMITRMLCNNRSPTCLLDAQSLLEHVRRSELGKGKVKSRDFRGLFLFRAQSGVGPLRTPTPLQSILWPILDPKFVTFGNTVTIFLSTNLHTFKSLETAQNLPEFPYPKNSKMCDPILGALIKMQPIILHLVVKMRLHPAAHTHQPTVRKYPPTGGGGGLKVTSTTDEIGVTGYLTL